MKIFKALLCCLLGSIITLACIYIINNKNNETGITTPEIIDKDSPIVELNLNTRDITVGDSVTYTVISRVESDEESFENNRTFYYDFTGDGTWDLITKKDTVTYTFLEAYEGGVQPKVAMEFRNKIGKADGEKIYVKSLLRPILLYTSYKNIVLFRDISMGNLIERKICFEEDECLIGNKNFIKSDKVDLNQEFGRKTDNPITKNDMFIQKYSDYGDHQVSIELKDKYGVYVKTGYTVKTSENSVNNGLISTGLNILTIPEITFSNTIPEIFLSTIMDNTLLMYVNYELDGTCYIDMDTSKDTDGDNITDNDKDAMCNALSKLEYSPENVGVMGRIIFTSSEGGEEFQDFYVIFEGNLL